MAEAEDPWDWDINLDSSLLLSVITDSTPQQVDSKVAEALASTVDASHEPIDDGAWLELDF